MMQIIGPGDETHNPDLEKAHDMDPESLLDRSDYGSECFVNNPAKNLCVHVLSSDGDEDWDESADDTNKPDDESNMSVTEEPEGVGDPTAAAAAVPLRDAMNRFRIVDIEQEDQTMNGIIPLGDAYSATTAVEPSAHVGNDTDANSASQRKSVPLRLQKVPAMFKPPLLPPPKQAAEADAIPSITYKAIMSGRSVKNTYSFIAGTGTAKADKNCGSSFNTGDNRVSCSVYKENVATPTVSSLSFNPSVWECSACPKKHSILGGGGGGLRLEGWGRVVIILADKSFPAVLPTANGNCLAIIQIDQGKIMDLVDLLFSISLEEFPHGTISVLGSLTHLQDKGLQGYANGGVKAGCRIASHFSAAFSILFTPPPPPMVGYGNPQLVKDILDSCCWLASLPAYPLRGAMKTFISTIEDSQGGGGPTFLP